ncbi:MAG: flagellar motor protein [Firmicutes bacterium]|nr:flagellar motor protein [Bacillota bacterium]
MTVIFLVFGFAMLILAFTIEGGQLSALFGIPALMIVLGGTVGAVGVTIPVQYLKNTFRLIRIALGNKKADLISRINYFSELSAKARREGLLSLENDMRAESVDPFTRKGVSMAVDGTNLELIRSIMETDIDQSVRRHKANAHIFEAAGGYSPTMGILGTVMGLVHVLSNLSNPTTLGGQIATAFLATMYGIGFANLVFLPIGAKLRALDTAEVNEKLMTMEAVLSIASGDNPKIMVQKLKVYLDPASLAKFEAAEAA